MRTANMINGTAPAKAWVGNLAAVAVRPLTRLQVPSLWSQATGKVEQLTEAHGWSSVRFWRPYAVLVRWHVMRWKMK